MRVAAAILLLALAGWREKQPDPEAVLTCMSSQPNRDDYSQVTRCEPLGKNERIAGTWFVRWGLRRPGRFSSGSGLL